MSSIGLVENWWDWVTAISWQLALFVLLIALISRALPRRWSRLRHALWLLVLLKVFLPPGLTAPWSLGQWAVRPAVSTLSRGTADEFTGNDTRSEQALASALEHLEGARPATTGAAATEPGPHWSPSNLKHAAFLIWIAGAAGLALLIAIQWLRLQGRLKSATIVDEGPLRIALEQTALNLGLSKTPELLLVEKIPSPFLVGLLRPRIVLPDRMAGMSAQQLTPVLAHELAHWKRYDAWIGCLQVAVQVVFWFHPCVWWANSQLRQERECACDDEVLQKTTLTPTEYGDSLVQCLMESRGERLAAGHVLGVLEQGTNLQTRMEQIMAHRKSRKSFGITSSVVVAGCAILLLPMALHPPITGGVAQAADPSAVPKIVSIEPENGAKDVDPAIAELKVTFDIAMGDGMSWTGGGDAFPAVPKGQEAKWSDDKKTCTLPVKLVPNHTYQLGLNSKSFKNFTSAAGVPLVPVRYTFTTRKAAGDSTDAPATESTASSAPLKPAPLDLDAAAAELSSKYGKAHPEVQEFVQQTMRSFGRSGLWLNEKAFSKAKPAEREARVAYLAKLFEESDYGRHLCSGLAEASALKDPKLLPGLKKVAAYHVDGKDYDCRAKWMAVAALARQESPDAVPVLVSLVDHGNQNTRFWARAALSRMAKNDFKDDKQAWNKWWVGAGHDEIDPALLKPYTPPMPK